ncbi:MAG: hypothetical protein AVDCRST_MAG18-289, partial [uncultured Thermomicrobiales bacterium]
PPLARVGSSPSRRNCRCRPTRPVASTPRCCSITSATARAPGRKLSACGGGWGSIPPCSSTASPRRWKASSPHSPPGVSACWRPGHRSSCPVAAARPSTRSSIRKTRAWRWRKRSANARRMSTSLAPSNPESAMTTLILSD